MALNSGSSSLSLYSSPLPSHVELPLFNVKNRIETLREAISNITIEGSAKVS